jgi:hypothetical protein
MATGRRRNEEERRPAPRCSQHHEPYSILRAKQWPQNRPLGTTLRILYRPCRSWGDSCDARHIPELSLSWAIRQIADSFREQRITRPRSCSRRHDRRCRRRRSHTPQRVRHHTIARERSIGSLCREAQPCNRLQPPRNRVSLELPQQPSAPIDKTEYTFHNTHGIFVPLRRSLSNRN